LTADKHTNQPQEETIDLKAILLKYAHYWYYFIISVLFCLFIAFLYNRYSKPIYSVSSTLLIRDDRNSQLGAENLLEGLEIFSGKTNLKNEIALLNSYSITKQVVEDLNFGISYFKHGKIITSVLYENLPFVVIVDSLHPQVTGSDFYITILNESEYNLDVSADDSYAYNIITEKFDKSIPLNVKIDETYKFGEVVEGQGFSFVVNKNNEHFRSVDLLNEHSYSFTIHNITSLVDKYVRLTTINPINKDASVLKLNIKGYSPRKNIDYLNKLTEAYIGNGLNEKNKMATNTVEFIESQIINVSDSLHLIESSLEKFKSENPNLAVTYKEFGAFYQIQKLYNELSVLETHHKYYQSLLRYVKENENNEKIVAPSTIGINDPLLNNLIVKLSELYAQQEEIRLTSQEKNPRLISIDSQISNLKKNLIENIKSIIASNLISRNELKARVKSFETEIESLPKSERDFVYLQRKFTLSENIYKYLLEKKEEAKIAKAGNVADHKVIDFARLDSKEPISPNKKLAYFIALIFGLGIPMSIISIRDFFNNTIRSKTDLTDSTDIPILGVIGHSDKPTNLVVLNNPKSAMSESFRSIRTNIQYLAADKQKKVIAISSSIGGEGKTFCSINLASVFALAGHKTVLIGADLRKPKIHEDFDVNEKIGLSSFLINKCSVDEAIQKSDVENMHIITSGPTPPNPAELLENPKMEELIKELQKTYAYVFIDTPPIGLVTDGVRLMKYADVNLYIVRHMYSKKKMLSIANTLFENKRVNNLNIIINDFQHSQNAYGYGYGYGYGGEGYGYYEEDEKI
tara:strand:- start:4931 stop:7339 length:2409 start_codon:yes stop_codon:yes gene_type:complete